MPRGRQTRTMRPDQIERLERFRRASHEGSPAGYSYPQLRLAMGSPCNWQTLRNALAGRPVWDLVYFKIAEWVERYLPAGKAPHDGKAAAAGDTPEKEDEAIQNHGATGTPVRRPGGE